jgi:MFS family permease
MQSEGIATTDSLERKRIRRDRTLSILALGAVLVVGTWLRMAGLNWDQDQHLNVDDYYVAHVATQRVSLPPNSTLNLLLDPQKSPLNPRTSGEFYVYGALPLYLVRGAASLIYLGSDASYFKGVNGILQTGRGLAGIADLATMLLTFLIGWRLWGKAQGLVAAALYSFAVLPLQMSHFFLTDDFMSAFMLAALFVSILYVQSRRIWLMLLAGLCIGLAMACKLSAAPTILIPLLAVGLALLASRGEEKAIRRGLLAIGLIAAGTFLGLFVGDPFAILDAPTYAKILAEQAAIQNGSIDQWFSRKYVGTWPVFYLLGQLVLIGIGPIAGCAGILGAFEVGYKAFRDRGRGQILLLWGALVYFASIAFVELKWVRYLLPLVPYLALFAAAFCSWVWSWAGRRGMGAAARAAPAGFLIATSIVGAFAVSSIFTSQNTQIGASDWIYRNVPQGSTIGYELTAIAMPLSLPGHPHPNKEYNLVSMDPLNDLPSEQAADALFSELSQAQYLIIDTTQAMRTVPHLPWRYPVQIRYYDLLNGGQLGFSLALKSTSYPSLLGLTFPDDGGWVDLSFMDSSHPPIYVLKKDRAITKEEWSALFADAVKQPSVASRYAP